MVDVTEPILSVSYLCENGCGTHLARQTFLSVLDAKMMDVNSAAVHISGPLPDGEQGHTRVQQRTNPVQWTHFVSWDLGSEGNMAGSSSGAGRGLRSLPLLILLRGGWLRPFLPEKAYREKHDGQQKAQKAEEADGYFPLMKQETNRHFVRKTLK